jgi:glutathione peroxidase
MIYDYTFKDRKGNEDSIQDFKGKVLLIVNTATGCGFTPQYKELQEIYAEAHEKGLEILDFPCDQFGHQAPGTDEEIHSFCTGRFGIEFPQFSKIEVNGENALPLYKFLTSNTKFEGFEDANPLSKVLMKMLSIGKKDFATSSDIKWNFTKFLIDREGNIVRRFEPTADMDKVKKAICDIL